MKKQFAFIAVTMSAMFLFSCSKETVENPAMNSSASDPSGDEFVTVQRAAPNTGNLYLESLKRGLTGSFQFDGNLKDATSQLIAAQVGSLGEKVSYTNDRKGAANKALMLTGKYGVDIFAVPLQATQSIAAWVRYGNALVPTIYFAEGDGVELGQDANKFFGAISTPMTTGVTSGPMDGKWHHLVATYDGTTLKFYVDGVLIGDSPNPATWGTGTGDYNLGGGHITNPYWKGAIDDLRFYNRVLSAQEVSSLVSL